MLLKDRARPQYGISQYRPPLCFELAGKNFEIAMDDGSDYFLNIIDKETLEWHIGDTAAKKENYICLKADDTTFMLTYEISDAVQKDNHTFIIDLENMLVTRLIVRNGDNKRYPFINNTYFEFGAIRKEDGSLEFKRHSFTDDMVGTCVQWNYGPFSTVHAYYCTNFYRITYPRDGSADQRTIEAMNAMVNQLPSPDEPAQYIRIKENMYLLNITEMNMEKVLGEKGGFRSDAMCFLQNYDRMYQVGRAFGKTTRDGVSTDLRMTFGAYGKFTELPDDFVYSPNPFIV